MTAFKFSYLVILFHLLFVTSFAGTTDSTESFDGTVIYYESHGEGDISLIFVHGWSCDKSYWKNQIDYFAENYKVVTIDLAGHGQSGQTRTDYTIEAFAEDVKAVADDLKLEHFVLIGHSMGGPVVIQASLIMPDRTAGFIGVDTFIDIENKPEKEQFSYFISSFKQDFYNTTIGFTSTMFTKDADTALVKSISKDMASAPPEVAISSFENLFGYDHIGAWQEVAVPVRMLQADIFPTNAEPIKKYAEDFDMRLMQGYGHFIMLEAPQLFNKNLEELIQSIIN